MFWYALGIAIAIMVGSYYLGGKIGQTNWERGENSVTALLMCAGFYACVFVGWVFVKIVSLV